MVPNEGSEGIVALALRTLKRPQSALATALGAFASRSSALTMALYSAVDEPELLASGGRDAPLLGPPGPVGAGFARTLRAWASDRGPCTRSAPGSPLPWSGHAHLVSVAGQLPSDEAVLLLVGGDEAADTGLLDATMTAVLPLSNALLSARREERYRSEMRRTRQENVLLVAGLQHDLRTPLTSILGCARTIRERGDEMPKEQHDELLDIIASQASRLSDMVGAALSRQAEGDDMPLRTTRVDPVAVAERVAKAACSARSGEISIDVRPVPVWTDEPRLERALLNLVDNALKYTPPGRAVQLIGEESGEMFTFTVADPGPGVDQEVVHSLFSPFARDPHRDGSMGLGLHSVAQLAEELGGRVTHARRAGWTRFCLSIPAGGARREPEQIPAGAEA